MHVPATQLKVLVTQINDVHEGVTGK